jgi:hypothetical protein
MFEVFMPLLEVCLVGDTPMSGYLGIMIKKPDSVVWFRNGKQRNIVMQIESAIKDRISSSFETRIVDDHNIEEFIQQCNQVIKDYPEHDILLNVSGGTRLQALLATEVFKQSGKNVVFIDTDHSRIFDLVTGEYKTFHFDFTVNEYIRLSGVEIESGTRFDPEIGHRSALSYFLGNNIDQVVRFIDEMREDWLKMGETKKDIQWRMNDSRTRFTVIYESGKDRMRFRFGAGENLNTMEISSNYAEYLFNGGWLRELVFLRIHKGQYDDIRLDVRLNRNTFPQKIDAESMVDIAMMRGCRFYIFQCFSYPVTKESFIELKAIHSTVNLLNARGYVFVSHYPHRGFIERVRDYGLELVYGRRISNFSV